MPAPTALSSDSLPGSPPVLEARAVESAVRSAGINPNHWYPLGWAADWPPGTVRPVVVWQQPLAVYRGTDGRVRALEDVCPHRGVELHRGKVRDDRLACRYHGWEFDEDGRCARIPYWPEGQKLPPCARARSYPVRERYGLLWVFPGDREASPQENRALADATPLPEVPEYGNPQYLMVPVTGQFQAHFSRCNENAMDVFHGFLHEDIQGWFDPVLVRLEADDRRACADYRVSYRGRMAQFLGLADRADEVATRTISVQYRYPHFASSLEGISSIYLMRLPVGPAESRSFALFFVRVKLPRWVLDPLRPWLSRAIERFAFRKFLDQDTEMMESEQRVYDRDPGRRFVEVNPAILAVQRTIVRQYEQFMQQSMQRASQPEFSEFEPAGAGRPEPRDSPRSRSQSSG